MNIKKRIISCSLAAATILSSVGAMGITASAAKPQVQQPTIISTNTELNGTSIFTNKFTFYLDPNSIDANAKYYAKIYTSFDAAKYGKSQAWFQMNPYWEAYFDASDGVNEGCTYYLKVIARKNGYKDGVTITTINTKSTSGPIKNVGGWR